MPTVPCSCDCCNFGHWWLYTDRRIKPIIKSFSMYNNCMITLSKNLKKKIAAARRFVLRNKIIAGAVVLVLVVSSVAAYTIPTISQKDTKNTTATVSEKQQSAGSTTIVGAANQADSSTKTKEGEQQPSNSTSTPGSVDTKSAAGSTQQSGGTSVATKPGVVQETPEQIYAREHKNLGQAFYNLSPTPTRSESGGSIYYTVTLHVEAFDPAAFGQPTLYAQLTPSTNNRYSCVNPVGTMAKFKYGTNGNTVTISCQIRACPECYYPGGPLPYYGAFTVGVGGITSGGSPTGTGSRSYDLSPGYDKPS